jgi:hypothetical protein
MESTTDGIRASGSSRLREGSGSPCPGGRRGPHAFAHASVACAFGGLLTSFASAQTRPTSQPLVLVLAGVASSRSASPASVLWFLVGSAGGSSGPSAVARQSPGKAAIGAPDQPSTWVAFDAAAPPAVIVALMSDQGLPSTTVESATSIVERALRDSAASGLTRPAMIAKVASALSAHVSASTGSGTVRLLETQELRISEGDIASARVGLVLSKHLEFGVGGSSYRVRFQPAGLERFRRAAPSP